MTRHWPIVVAVVLVLLAFLAGRLSAPQRVVTRDVVRTQTVEVEKIRTVEVHDQVEAKEAAERVRTVTVTRWRWLPGGGTEAETTTTRAADTTARQTKQERASATTETAKATQATTVELHTVERVPVLPQWSIAVMPGVDLRGASTLPYHAVVGVAVERRIAGPLFVGAWGNTAGAAGISIRGDL